ncbi:MAG: hypothetical protein KKE17_10600 [Proteobacteria bacterium]|nr:hypothetical protein [Pseudomonadota bacterium]MBU1710441.1 hypothetical protein [Pseudomonadota bacterium]
MADCELLENCLFFNDKMENMPDASEVIKEYYCRKMYKRCARFVYKKVTNEVPGEFYPNDMSKVAKNLGWDISWD